MRTPIDFQPHFIFQTLIYITLSKNVKKLQPQIKSENN